MRLASDADLAPGLRALGLDAPRPVVVLVGGASGLADDDAARLWPLFADGLIPAVTRHRAVAIDGGTQSGVMRLLGEAHRAAGATTPLVGVAAEQTIALPGTSATGAGRAPLQPDHTHFVLVPGDAWDAESPWIARIATVVAAGAPSCTVLADGGDIAYDDVAHSIDAGRPVLTIAGSGRTADEVAAALRGDDADPRAASVVTSGLVQAVGVDEPAAVRAALHELLDGRTTSGGADVG